MVPEVSSNVPLGIDIAQLVVLLGIFRRLGQHSAAITSLRGRVSALETEAMATDGKGGD